jgi:hypothetical protein
VPGEFRALGSNGDHVAMLALSVMGALVMQKNKKARKPLALHHETLRVLTAAELAAAAGGSNTTDDTAIKVTSAACHA